MWWKVVAKAAGAGVTGLGAVMYQGTPETLHANICSWRVFAPCPLWLGPSAIDLAIQITLWASFLAFVASLILPKVFADYRAATDFAWAASSRFHTEFKGQFMAGPRASPSLPDEDGLPPPMVSNGTEETEPDLSVWKFFHDIQDLSDPVAFISNIQKFRQLAYDGKIDVWGQETPYGVRKALPSAYWEFYTIDLDSLIRDGSFEATSKLATQVRSISMPKMILLKTNAAQVVSHFKEHA